MARISFIGMGGGGSRFISEVHRWFEAEEAKGPESEVGLWRFGTVTRTEHSHEGTTFGMPHGAALIALDVSSADLQDTESVLDVDAVYQLADRPGFGGDRGLGFNVIAEQEGGNNETPSITPLTRWLKDDCLLENSHVVFPCFSLDGGTGRGAFEFLLRRWGEVFTRADLVTACITFLPPQYGQGNRRLAREIETYLTHLEGLLADGSVGMVFMNSYDTAFGLFSSMATPGIQTTHDEYRLQLEEAVGCRSGAGIGDMLAKLGSLPSRGIGSNAVDAGALSAMAGILANSIGPMVPEDKEFQISVPKYLDVSDFKEYFKGQFVVPCYRELSTPIGEIHKNRDPDHPWIGENGVQPEEHPLKRLMHDAISLGSLAPLPPVNGPSPNTLKGKVKNVLAVVWAEETIEAGELGAIAAYSRLALNADCNVFLLTGGDPMAGYVKSRKNGAEGHARVKIWVYIGLPDSSLIKEQVRLAAFPEKNKSPLQALTGALSSGGLNALKRRDWSIPRFKGI